MLSGTQRMANDAQGHVVVAAPSGLYEVVPKGDGSFSARPYPIGAGTCRCAHARDRAERFATLVWLRAPTLCRRRRARFDVWAGGRFAGRCLGRNRHHT
jgi:hypothetical protein